jgi:ATP-dependent Clp protease ATP-binding subunit ClpC
MNLRKKDMRKTIIYEIFYPELDAYVKFKVLSPEGIETFMQGCDEMHKQEFMKCVVDTFVYNLKSEIVLALRALDTKAALNIIQSLYYGCVMLNPRLDVDEWLTIASKSIANPITLELTSGEMPELEPDDDDIVEGEIKKISRPRYSSLRAALKQVIIGQDEAIDVVSDTLKRSIVGLNDENAPLGVYLFAGSSGVGKTETAKQLHKHLFGKDGDMVRIDCGNFQHKHDAQRLVGSANGYVGYEDGGLLTNKIIENPNTVVLLDEVEKAHPDFWNSFLQVFDEGYLLDNKGNKANFRNTVIILTTNLGNSDVLELFEGKSVGFGENRRKNLEKARLEAIVTEKVKSYFRPELVNRIDKIVVFNHLNADDLSEIANLELEKVAKKLSPKGIRFKWDDGIIKHMVQNAGSTYKGARGMARIRQQTVEDLVADTLLENTCPKGTILELVTDSDKFAINVTKPKKKTKVIKES